MGRVVISNPDQVSPQAFPQLCGVTASDNVSSRGVIATPDRSLFFWLHDLPGGAVVELSSPVVDHLFYIWAGEADAGGKMLATDFALIVEHGGAVKLRAGRKGATLAHFHRREDHPERPTKPGGAVHVRDAAGIFKMHNESLGMYKVQYADAQCSTCDIWLHKNDTYKPRRQGGRHFHTEDEIIVVRKGTFVVGKRQLPAGTALAIDAKTIYSFGVPDEGLEFLNFRTSVPYYVKVGDKNQPLHAPIPELELAQNAELHGLALDEPATAEQYSSAGFSL